VENLTGTGEPSTLSQELAPAVTAVAPALALGSAPALAVVARRPCRISFEGMLATEPPRVEVHAWLEKLGALTAPMTGGQVQIEAVDRGRKEQHYRVRMDLTLTTGVVVVDYDHPSNGPHEDVYVAIRNAFRAARRLLEIHFGTMSAQATGPSS
jgi:hypothetical protein